MAPRKNIRKACPLLRGARMAFMLLMAQEVLSEIQQTRYSKLSLGANIFDVNYVYHPSSTAVMCGAVCHQWPGCFLFTFDTTSRTCQLVPKISAIVTLVSAPITRVSFFAWTTNSYTYVVTDTPGTWDYGKAACEALGGHMAILPDATYGPILYHVYGTMYLGLWRPQVPDDINTWYDVHNAVITHTIGWGQNQPNNYGGNQYVVQLNRGFADDKESDNMAIALCAIRV